MKKLLILSVAIFAAIACSDRSTTSVDDEVVIETLDGSQFTLSQFGAYRFPATDSWTIEDQSATTEDFETLSAAIEYISNNYPERQISIDFSALEAIPAYAIFGVALEDSSRNFSALTSVSAPYATSLGAYAFEFCTNLKTIDLPNATSIGNYALRNCSSLTQIDLPVATSISNAAFNGCSSLSVVNIPLVESIGDQTFRLCDSLVEIELPSVVSLGSGAFTYCTALERVDAPSLLTIGDYAFCDCSNLSEINIPIVEEIGSYAFIACKTLESFTLPATLSILGDGIFNDCTAMSTMDVESQAFTYIDGIIYNDDLSEAIAAIPSVVTGEISLPQSVTSMRSRIFYNCTNITSVELPSVESVSAYAFANCTELLSASFPMATTLESNAMLNCEMMTSLEAPMATTLEEYSLCNCEDLVDLSLATAPNIKLESIDTHALYSAILTNITLTVGAANADMVAYGDTLTVGNYEAEFNEIIVLTE
ncbi:MAG: leucine-rich repeat protein [Rikenellaceae bacterium]